MYFYLPFTISDPFSNPFPPALLPPAGKLHVLELKPARLAARARLSPKRQIADNFGNSIFRWPASDVGEGASSRLRANGVVPFSKVASNSKIRFLGFRRVPTLYRFEYSVLRERECCANGFISPSDLNYPNVVQSYRKSTSDRKPTFHSKQPTYRIFVPQTSKTRLADFKFDLYTIQTISDHGVNGRFS
ncbi:hypothetical protein R3P38DRAFT_2805879 [Favolaschia claudopus]|uniref:Ribosomal protein L5 n=1 Tax=Favolaschia claudopus TaxID=2862362 RepID=A0AAV9ZLU5_9AGAR